jgi:hypothetical protein
MTDASSTTSLSGESAAVRRFLYGLVIAVAAGNGLASIQTTTRLFSAVTWPQRRPVHTPMFSANDRSRWCTVWSLVERGTYQIDEIIQRPGWDTIDKVKFRDGHFYSSKPPLLATVVAGIYWVVKHAFGLDLLTQTHETVHTILIVLNLIPWIAALVVLAAIGERYVRTDRGRVFLVVAAAFGTFLTTFLITLNNHTVAAVSLIFALYPLLRIWVDRQTSPWLFGLAGFWSAFLVCNELPACVFGLAAFGAAVYRAPGPTWKYFMPAALVPLAAFFYTNWLCTDGIMPFYASFTSETNNYYRYEVNGVPSYWTNPVGIDKGEVSAGVYLWHCTFGHHGIFSLSPIYLPALAGWAFVWRLHRRNLGDVCWLSLGLTVWVLVFYVMQSHSRNYGGVTSGLRWAFWLIPLWLLTVTAVLDEWGDRRWLRVLMLILLAASVFSTTFPRTSPWQHPWLYDLMQP